MQNLPIVQRVTVDTRTDEPAKFCFRYRGGRRHHRLYDVLMTLDEPGGVCHIEVCHALPASADLPALTSGHLDAARLMRALDLIGLVKRVTSRDHTTRQPGRLVFDAHMQLPWRPTASPPSTRTSPAGTSPDRHARSRLVSESVAPVPFMTMRPAPLFAQQRTRYPLHGLGRCARLKRRVSPN